MIDIPFASANASPAIVGTVVTVTNGNWTGSPDQLHLCQWQRSDVTNISGATAASYTLVSADIGGHKQIACLVTARQPRQRLDCSAGLERHRDLTMGADPPRPIACPGGRTRSGRPADSQPQRHKAAARHPRRPAGGAPAGVGSQDWLAYLQKMFGIQAQAGADDPAWLRPATLPGTLPPRARQTRCRHQTGGRCKTSTSHQGRSSRRRRSRTLGQALATSGRLRASCHGNQAAMLGALHQLNQLPRRWQPLRSPTGAPWPLRTPPMRPSRRREQRICPSLGSAIPRECRGPFAQRGPHGGRRRPSAAIAARPGSNATSNPRFVPIDRPNMAAERGGQARGEAAPDDCAQPRRNVGMARSAHRT